MSKIVVVGNEEFCMGFELIGIDAYSVSEIERLISKKEDTGIVVISREDYDSLNIRLKNDISKLIKPIVVILSKDDIKGDGLREQIIKALGVDLLK